MLPGTAGQVTGEGLEAGERVSKSRRGKGVTTSLESGLLEDNLPEDFVMWYSPQAGHLSLLVPGHSYLVLCPQLPWCWDPQLTHSCSYPLTCALGQGSAQWLPHRTSTWRSLSLPCSTCPKENSLFCLLASFQFYNC